MKKIEVRTDPFNYDLTVPDDVQHLFVDGVTSTNTGIPATRVVFFRLDPHIFGEDIPPPGSPERRVACLELTIPTAALINFAKKFLQSVEQNKENLTAALHTMTTVYAEELKQQE